MAYQRDLVAEDDRRLTRKLKAKGMQVAVLTPEQIKVFRDKCAAVYKKFTPRIGADVVSAIQDAVDNAVAKHEATHGDSTEPQRK